MYNKHAAQLLRGTAAPITFLSVTSKLKSLLSLLHYNHGMVLDLKYRDYTGTHAFIRQVQYILFQNYRQIKLQSINQALGH